jgi:hypothetical protein
MVNHLPDRNHDADLARYQAALLDILYDGENGEHMIVAIRAAAGPFSPYLGPLDPMLLEVAAALTRTWGSITLDQPTTTEPSTTEPATDRRVEPPLD